MTETLFALLANYGVAILFCVTFLSCLALPVPSSLLMLASGGFAATGDLQLTGVLAAAFAGAILGDNTGYWVARLSGQRLADYLARRPKRAALYKKAQGLMEKWGDSAVFFSCWLVSPLGPYVNYVSGLTQFGWPRFAVGRVLGEMVWVGLYVGLGYAFADNISALASLLGNLSGLITAFVAMIALGFWLWRQVPRATVRT